MAQGLVDRLTYERIGILLSDSPAFKESGSKFKNLIRVQNMNYGFSHNSIDVKEIGSDALVTKGLRSPVLRAPDVNCEISYFFAGAFNENAAGLYSGANGSILKKMLNNENTDDINIIAVSSNKNEHQDIFFLSQESDFEGFDIIGIGNAFLTGYKFNASVGQFPSAALSYSGSNINFDLYSSSEKPKLPAIKLGSENSKSDEELNLNKSLSLIQGDFINIFDGKSSTAISATVPGDITASIFKMNGDQGGATLDSVNAAIQSIEIDIPLSRQDVYGMGSNFVFDKKLQLPVVGSLNMNMVLREYSQDDREDFLSKNNIYEIIINQPIRPRASFGQVGEFLVEGDNFFISVEEGVWRYTKVILEFRKPFFQGFDFISNDSNFYYVKVSSESIAKIALRETSKSFPNYTVKQKVIEDSQLYINTNAGWKAVYLVDIDTSSLSNMALFNIANNLTFELNNVQLKEQSYTHQIGSDVMVSSSMTFGVSANDGFKMYGRFIPRVAPQWEIEQEVLSFTENDTSFIDYNKNIDIGDSKVHYYLRGYDKGAFNYDGEGSLSFKSPPDYDSKNLYKLQIVATNEAGVSIKNIEINILNIVERMPVWGSIFEIININENQNNPQIVYNDDLYPGDGTLSYSLSGKDASKFSISDAGEIALNESTDYETKRSYNIDVVASNEKGFTSKSLYINIINEIDSAPEFKNNFEIVYFEPMSLRDKVSINKLKTFYDYPVTYELYGPNKDLFSVSDSGDISYIGQESLDILFLEVSVKVYNSIGEDSKDVLFMVEYDFLVRNEKLFFIDQDLGVYFIAGSSIRRNVLGERFSADFSDPDFAYFAKNGYDWIRIPFTEFSETSFESMPNPNIGDQFYDSGYLYFYTDFLVWKRIAITK